jgi:hypothetical protein
VFLKSHQAWWGAGLAVVVMEAALGVLRAAKTMIAAMIEVAARP